MVPLGSRFCYLTASVSLSEDDLKEYLDEPVAALPPAIAAKLPPVQILLVPYLELGPEGVVATEKPQEKQTVHSSAVATPQGALLAFAVKDAEVADVHYRFYRAIAELVTGPKPEAVPAEYYELLRQEFAAAAHGEVDEAAWGLKSELSAADMGTKKTKRFKAYARVSFVDTLTLYLHGICCDIDVDPGPRQLASYLLRRRLRYLRGLYPPPKGYAVLPEDEKAG
jgi:hypothetical protein